MPKINLRVVHVQDTLCVAQVIDPADLLRGSFIAGNVSNEWRRRKQVTENSAEADADTVLVNVGDDVTITVSDGETSE